MLFSLPKKSFRFSMKFWKYPVGVPARVREKERKYDFEVERRLGENILPGKLVVVPELLLDFMWVIPDPAVYTKLWTPDSGPVG